MIAKNNNQKHYKLIFQEPEKWGSESEKEGLLTKVEPTKYSLSCLVGYTLNIRTMPTKVTKDITEI